MNLNRLVLGDHVEFEANTYYASFTAELEAAAIPMWALVREERHLVTNSCINSNYSFSSLQVSHLKDEKTRDYTANVLKYCLAAIREWWGAIHYDSPKIVSSYFVIFKSIGLC